MISRLLYSQVPCCSSFDSSNDVEKQVPLLDEQDPSLVNENNTLTEKQLARYSILIGFCTGCFVHLSTLGTSFLMLFIWGAEVLSNVSLTFELFGLLFSSVIAILAVGILTMLHKVLAVVLRQQRASETQVEETLGFLSFCHLVGSVIGMLVSVIATEAMIQHDMQRCVIQTAIGLCWVSVISVILKRRESSRCSTDQQ